MRHRLTLTSNPRLILLILILVVLPAAGVLLLIFAGIVIGIIALAAAGYLDYLMLRFFRNHLKSWVETSDSELTCKMPDGDLLTFPWEKITVAGCCTPAKGRPFLFVYRDEGDKLVTIPNEYTDFDMLQDQISRRRPFREISLVQGESIQKRLKQILNIEE